MKKRKDLVVTKEYILTTIQLNLFNHIKDYMSKNNINRTQLAEQLKVTKGYVSQILNGDFDHKISKLVDLYLAIDKIPEIIVKDKNIVQEEVSHPETFDLKSISHHGMILKYTFKQGNSENIISELVANQSQSKYFTRTRFEKSSQRKKGRDSSQKWSFKRTIDHKSILKLEKNK